MQFELWSFFRHESTPGVVLQGLIEILPMAQRSTEDHYVIIKSRRGICSIVVRLHHVLGLSILVRKYNRVGKTEDVQSGPAPDHIVLSVGTDEWRKYYNKDVSITLLLASMKESAFEKRPRGRCRNDRCNIQRPGTRICHKTTWSRRAAR